MEKKLKYISEKLVKYGWATYPHHCLLVLDFFASHPLIRSKETKMCRLLKKLRHFDIYAIICVQTVKSFLSSVTAELKLSFKIVSDGNGNIFLKYAFAEGDVENNAYENNFVSFVNRAARPFPIQPIMLPKILCFIFLF